MPTCISWAYGDDALHLSQGRFNAPEASATKDPCRHARNKVPSGFNPCPERFRASEVDRSAGPHLRLIDGALHDEPESVRHHALPKRLTQPGCSACFHEQPRQWTHIMVSIERIMTEIRSYHELQRHLSGEAGAGESP